MAISSTLKNIYASAPSNSRYIETLQFSHSLFSKSYYMCGDNQPWTFLLESGAAVSFQPMPFKIILPGQDSGGTQDLTLTLANIGLELVTPIEQANEKPDEPIRCTYRVYVDTPSSMPQTSPPLLLTITGVQISRDTISAVATRADVLNRDFPRNIYSIDKFPGLHR